MTSVGVGSAGHDLVGRDHNVVFRTGRVGHSQLPAIAVERSEGSYLWDYDDQRYIDFSSQWVFANVGHQHPRMLNALHRQVDTLCMIAPSYVSEIRTEAAEAICKHAPTGMNRVFFTGGGGEANEHAVRFARLFTRRHKVLSSYRSYHGSTSTALALTGDKRRWPLDMATNGVVHFFTPYQYRSSFYASDERVECARSLEHLRSVILHEGPNTIAAILIEPICSAAGSLIPPAGYLQGVRDLCDRWGILLIFDEIVLGFGRTGAWFSSDHWGVAPNLMTFAKGVTSGYAPLGGVLIDDRVAAHFQTEPYPMGPTFSGHQLGCVACVENIHILEEENLIERAAEVGHDIIGPALRKMADTHPCVGDVRGMGVYWTLELAGGVTDVGTGVTQDQEQTIQRTETSVDAACRERGLIASVRSGHIGVAPPCNIPFDALNVGLEALDDALDVADKHYT